MYCLPLSTVTLANRITKRPTKCGTNAPWISTQLSRTVSCSACHSIRDTRTKQMPQWSQQRMQYSLNIVDIRLRQLWSVYNCSTTHWPDISLTSHPRWVKRDKTVQEKELKIISPSPSAPSPIPVKRPVLQTTWTVTSWTIMGLWCSLRIQRTREVSLVESMERSWTRWSRIGFIAESLWWTIKARARTTADHQLQLERPYDQRWLSGFSITLPFWECPGWPCCQAQRTLGRRDSRTNTKTPKWTWTIIHPRTTIWTRTITQTMSWQIQRL